MTKVEITICNRRGLHARAAAKFVSVASEFNSDIGIGHNEDQLQDGKSIMSVMMLAAGKGTTLILSADGTDEGQAIQAICDLVNDKFGEGE